MTFSSGLTRSRRLFLFFLLSPLTWEGAVPKILLMEAVVLDALLRLSKAKAVCCRVVNDNTESSIKLLRLANLIVVVLIRCVMLACVCCVCMCVCFCAVVVGSVRGYSAVIELIKSMSYTVKYGRWVGHQGRRFHSVFSCRFVVVVVVVRPTVFLEKLHHHLWSLAMSSVLVLSNVQHLLLIERENSKTRRGPLAAIRCPLTYGFRGT